MIIFKLDKKKSITDKIILNFIKPSMFGLGGSLKAKDVNDSQLYILIENRNIILRNLLKSITLLTL